jgi:hypothetical protein
MDIKEAHNMELEQRSFTFDVRAEQSEQGNI